jgi:serine/threonine-protein kinase HipA
MDRKYDHATYSGLARLLDALCPEDIPEYVRRLAAMVVMGNLDAHLKNWSLCYPDGRTARLSPAYDLISVSAYPAFGRDELAFALDGGRIARNISMLHFRRFAERAGLDVGMVLSEAARTVRELVDGWPGVRNDHLIPAHLVGHIDERLRTLPLVVEALKVR